MGQTHDDSGEHEDDESNHIHDECSVFDCRSVGMGLSGRGATLVEIEVEKTEGVCGCVW